MKELIDAKDKGPEEVERFQNVEELLSGIQEFSNSGDEDNPNTLADFILRSPYLRICRPGKAGRKNHVPNDYTFGKGLEFPKCLSRWDGRKISFLHRCHYLSV